MTLINDDIATILRLETELKEATALSADLRIQLVDSKKTTRCHQAELKVLKAKISDLELEARILAAARSRERKEWATGKRRFKLEIKELQNAYDNLHSKLLAFREHLSDL
jgi:chromosome segregation ATPase